LFGLVGFGFGFNGGFDNLCRLFSAEKDFNFPAQTVFGLETTLKPKLNVSILNNFLIATE
jgi:hypothetical protein